MEEKQADLEATLRQFTGTLKYYRSPTGLLYTDGVRYLAERAGAYWLLDLVGSYQPTLLEVPFQVWGLEVRDDKSAVVTMVEDDGEPIRVRQEIAFTDFPLKNFSFYCCVDGPCAVMLLKSEY